MGPGGKPSRGNLRLLKPGGGGRRAHPRQEPRDGAPPPALEAPSPPRARMPRPGAPSRQDGKPVGSLGVASTVVGRRYRETEREALVAFADHASLAVTDAARTRQMLHSALHDALTGLPNRALFSDRLDQRLV